MCSEPGKTEKLFFLLCGIREVAVSHLMNNKQSSRCNFSINTTRPTEDTLFPITSQVAAATSFFCLTECKIFT